MTKEERVSLYMEYVKSGARSYVHFLEDKIESLQNRKGLYDKTRQN